MSLCPSPTPLNCRDDVVRVARSREPGVTIEQIANDFGVHSMTLQKWLLRVPGSVYRLALMPASSRLSTVS